MADLAARLTEALDRAERAALAADQGNWGVGTLSTITWGPHREQPSGVRVFDSDGEWPKPLKIRGSHIYTSSGGCGMIAHLERCGRHQEANADHIAAWQPAIVLRLIERDRALIADLANAEAAYADPTTALAPTIQVARNNRRLALQAEVKRAAAFWLSDHEEAR